ncbi:hypothetical protein D3C75_1063820 [compost metagenome]
MFFGGGPFILNKRFPAFFDLNLGCLHKPQLFVEIVVSDRPGGGVQCPFVRGGESIEQEVKSILAVTPVLIQLVDKDSAQMEFLLIG